MVVQGPNFDPYHRWLGIPPKHQPPNHYRLLGLELFEPDSEVIRDAANRQMAHVRSYQLGEYSGLSQRVLNELAAARACLLDESSKAEYDSRLREKLAAEMPIAKPAPRRPPAANAEYPPVVEDAQPVAPAIHVDISPRGGPSEMSRRGVSAGAADKSYPTAFVVALGAAAIVLLLVLLTVLGLHRRDYASKKGDVSQAAKTNPVRIAGKLYYRPGVDKIGGDEGSVIIALPELAGETGLEKKIPVFGLRPQDPEPRDSNASCRAIKNLGGAYTQADESGEFSIELPEKGIYRLLLISRHTSRRKGTEIDELERVEIARYFTSATDLVGRYKYRWLTKPIDLGHPPIEQDFGLNEGH